MVEVNRQRRRQRSCIMTLISCSNRINHFQRYIFNMTMVFVFMPSKIGFTCECRAFKLHQIVVRNEQCDQNVLSCSRCLKMEIWLKSGKMLIYNTKQFASLLCFNNLIAINYLRFKLKNRIRIMPTIQRNKCNAKTMVSFNENL